MIKDSFLGAKVWARLEPRPFPQLRQPVVYRSKVVESLWQRGCLSQISYSLAVWAVFFSSVFFPKVLFLQTILKTCCFFFSNLIVIRALLIKNKCNKAEWLGYFYIFLFKKKKSLSEWTTMSCDVFPPSGWRISHLLFQLWLTVNLLTLRHFIIIKNRLGQ